LGGKSLRNSRRDSTGREPPRDLAELARRLNACCSGGSAKVSAVAAYAVEYPLEVVFGTAARVANQCGVSTPTVVRLAQILGFEGFLEMREFFRQPFHSSRDRRTNRSLSYLIEKS
jgi:DNA-binding MurR/RpiR family transcriptional regulator